MKKLAPIFFALFSSFLAQAETVRVLSYNTWGVPIAAWDTWRYQEAMKAIEEQNPDIVILSEVFSHKGKRQFKSDLYPYHADGANWFPRLTGSGLRILSKFPIDEHAILSYRDCKKEDCLSHKGANLITVALPSGKKLNIVSTHLNAAGGEETRLNQLDQLSLFSDGYEDKSAPTLIAGDFNFNPLSNEYQYALQKLGAVDAWAETHAANESGYTYDCETNHYAHDYMLKTGGRTFQGRIDYFFHRGNMKTTSTEITMNDPEHLFSDHYGILGEFEI